MSTTYTSASKRFSSSISSATDNNQREVLISQLRADILELKQNEREYADLSSQLRKLEQRYSLLQEETAKEETDFKGRKKENFETIVNLRTDIDTLKSTIADTKIEIQDLRVEGQTLKDLSEQKTQEVQAFRREVADASEDNTALSEVKRKLETELEVEREAKRKNLAQLKAARENLSELNYKINELDKIMKEMEYTNTKTERQNIQLQQTIDNLQVESKTRTQNLDTIEQQVSDSQKVILSLEKDIQEAGRENEKNRTEVLQKQKQYQQEATKSLDLSAKMAIAENTLRAREAELEELKREYESLKAAHSGMLDNNFQLTQELEAANSDISGISAQNSEIVEELDRLAQEDEQVRNLLNRRNRVEALKYKSESQLKKSNLRSKNQFSPSPDRSGRGLKTGSSLKKSPYHY